MDLLDQICRSLEINPDDWDDISFSGRCYLHRPSSSKLRFRLSTTGFACAIFEPNCAVSIEFSYLESLRLRRAIRKWKAQQKALKRLRVDVLRHKNYNLLPATEGKN